MRRKIVDNLQNYIHELKGQWYIVGGAGGRALVALVCVLHDLELRVAVPF